MKYEWKHVGIIDNNEDFERLKLRSLKSDHGEERMVIMRHDKTCADCYCRETEESAPKAVALNQTLSAMFKQLGWTPQFQWTP